MDTFRTDDVVETLCAEFETVTSPTEAHIVATRIVALGKKLDFSDMQWQCLSAFQNECHARLEKMQ